MKVKPSTLRQILKWNLRIFFCVCLISFLASHLLEEERKKNPHHPDIERGYIIPEPMKGGTVYNTNEQHLVANFVGWVRVISFWLSFTLLVIQFWYLPEDRGKF